MLGNHEGNGHFLSLVLDKVINKKAIATSEYIVHLFNKRNYIIASFISFPVDSFY